MTDVTTIQSKSETLGLRLDIENLASYVVARIYKPTPKAKFLKEKSIYAYRFPTMEQLLAHVDNFLSRIISNAEFDKKEKEARKQRQEAEAANLQVGDVFVSCWGYEQTNVDFYQIVEKKTNKTATVRKIACVSVKETGWASDMVKAAKDSFIGEPFKVRLQGDYFNMSSYKGAKKVYNENETFHRSWYG